MICKKSKIQTILVINVGTNGIFFEQTQVIAFSPPPPSSKLGSVKFASIPTLSRGKGWKFFWSYGLTQ